MFLSLILLNILSSRLIESSLFKCWLKSYIYSSGLFKFFKIISGILIKWFSFDKPGSKYVVARSIISKELETLFIKLLANHMLLS